MAALRTLQKEKQRELLQATGQLFTSSGSAVKTLLGETQSEDEG